MIRESIVCIRGGLTGATALLGIVFAAACGTPSTSDSGSVQVPSPAPLETPPRGTIAGRIEFQSTDAARPFETLANVFVYVKAGLEGKKYPVPAEPVVLDQVTFQFVPHVFGIRAGQTLKITSQDASQHNVFCQPFKNPGFNVSMFGGEAVEKTFPSPEVMILLQCNIHHIMKAYAGVLDHPFFTVTGADGRFEIRGLPPGRYTLAAWQEFRGSREVEVDLGPDRGARTAVVFK